MGIKFISEGAEAKVYSVEFIGRESILKRRIKKSYRIKEIDEELRTNRTRNEARILGLVSGIGINSPVLFFVDRGDIIMERINGISLNEIIRHREGTSSVFSTLGIYAAVLHNNNIAHGDYTPANVIVSKGRKPYLIDFGLSEITNSIEEKALDILLMKRSISTESFNIFLKRYKRSCINGKAILKRLSVIEKRGRYNTRTLLTV